LPLVVRFAAVVADVVEIGGEAPLVYCVPPSVYRRRSRLYRKEVPVGASGTQNV
jgi:hypothetical protein